MQRKQKRRIQQQHQCANTNSPSLHLVNLFNNFAYRSQGVLWRVLKCARKREIIGLSQFQRVFLMKLSCISRGGYLPSCLCVKCCSVLNHGTFKYTQKKNHFIVFFGFTCRCWCFVLFVQAFVRWFFFFFFNNFHNVSNLAINDDGERLRHRHRNRHHWHVLLCEFDYDVHPFACTQRKKNINT